MADDECFTVPTLDMLGCSFGNKLKRIVDKAQDIETRLGLRVYLVKIIHTCWTGPERGMGAELVVREMTILPVPEVGALSGIRKSQTPIGLDEVGSLQVTRISGRYTEAEVMGAEINGIPYDPRLGQAYYEITMIAPGTPDRRRFSVNGVPSYKPDDAAWTVSLERAREDRDAYTGDPQ